MQMEFQMRGSHLQRPCLFFHSPLLKLMPPLIYVINNVLLRKGSKSDETASLISSLLESLLPIARPVGPLSPSIAALHVCGVSR